MTKPFKFFLGALAALCLLPVAVMVLIPSDPAADKAREERFAKEEQRKADDFLIYQCRQAIKATLHDPSSFTFISGVVQADRVYVNFRAKNKLNALVVDTKFCNR